MQRLKSQAQKQQGGFALLEVVIAMFVLAIGILGAGALQTASMQTTQGAYYRSQAMLLAGDALNRMRANRAVASSYVGTDTASISGSNSCIYTTGGCSAASLATEDARQWATLVTNSKSLPNARGQITSTAASQYVITISWNENEWQSNTYARAANTKNYILNVALDSN